jgi:hypothetical protein
MLAQDESGNEVPGSDIAMYYYPAITPAQASENCAAQGGTFSEL